MASLAVARQHPSTSPAHEAVVGALQRILNSADFMASDRNRRFLTYIVEETLAGRADRLKGYNIAVQVFGRDSSFDAQADPLVRIEAGRLRRSLERYYLTTGQSDPVRISIPKGHYVPDFVEHVTPARPTETARPEAQPSAPANDRETTFRGKSWRFAVLLAASIGIGIAALMTDHPVSRHEDASIQKTSQPRMVIRPSLLIQPFSNIGDDPAETYFSTGLTEELTVALGRFKTIQVFSGTNERPVFDTSSGAGLQRGHYDYVLKGSVRKMDHTFRVAVHLEDARAGGVLWTRIFDRETTSAQFLNVQSDIAGKIAETLGDPYNVLFTNETKRMAASAPAGYEAYACVLKMHAYAENIRPGEYRDLRVCHEKTVKAAPLFTDAWVNLAWLYVDEYRFDYSPFGTERPPLDRAADAARHAITLEPDNARAHLVMAIVQWFRRDFHAFDQEANLALSLNENDAAIAAELGMRFALRGEWERAQPLLDHAVEFAPFKRHLYRVAYSLRAYETGDYVLALEEARRTNLPDHPTIQLLRAAIYGQVGRPIDARDAWQSVLQKISRIGDEPRFWLFNRGISDSLTDGLMEGFDKAGVLHGE